MAQTGATYLSGLELVFDAMLEAFAFDFHGCKHQTIADKMCRVTDAFWCFEAEMEDEKFRFAG